MSVSGFVKGTWLRKLHVIERPAETYLLAGGARAIFDVNDGPIWLVALFGVANGDLDDAATGATLEFTVNNVAVDGAARVGAGSAAGDIVVCPLDTTAVARVPAIGVGCANVPDATALALGAGQMVVTSSIAGVAPGELGLTIAGGNCTATLTMYAAYYRMSPAASVTVA